MKVYELPAETKAATGYTHKTVITHSDLTEATANTAQTIELLDVAAGDWIVSASLVGSGSPATPFSAAVS